ncbi:MAG: DUF883 domain-containing protein [Proteobacteria bacterium]|nr:MAG: DUF883 domain-containing protein [Pseudomonadota bacterium]
MSAEQNDVRNDINDTNEASVQKLMQDLRQVVRDVEGLLKATAGQAGEKAGEARLAAEEKLRSAKARLGELEQKARAGATDAAGEADRYVRDNPWQAVGIAAGVAFLVGVLVSRR